MNITRTLNRSIVLGAVLMAGAVLLPGCGFTQSYAASTVGPRAGNDLASLLQAHPEARAVAQLRLVNVSSGEVTPLVFLSTDPPEIQANRLAYFLRAYRTDGDNVGPVIATLALVFPHVPSGGSYYSSANDDRFMMGLCMGGDFVGGSGRTSWSHNRDSYATLRLQPEAGNIYTGSLSGRLVRNDDSAFFLVEQGAVALR